MRYTCRCRDMHIGMHRNLIKHKTEAVKCEHPVGLLKKVLHQKLKRQSTYKDGIELVLC